MKPNGGFGPGSPRAMNERSCEPEAIRKGLAGIRDFRGVTGTITMRDDHNPKKGMVIMTVENGKFIFYSRLN